MGKLVIAGKEFNSRIFLGTGKFGNHHTMRDAVIASGTELVTVAFKRVDLENQSEDLLSSLRIDGLSLLPNTSGARNAKEAVLLSEVAREALETNWVKLEIHPDPRYLLPDPIETLEAARVLVQEGFVVLPYINADPVLVKRLENVGVQAVMPLGSPIGSNQGLKTRSMLEIIVAESTVPVIIDAGLGLPSHAADALEMGADAVLVNTAIASAEDPINMARAFKLAVEAGRTAYLAGQALVSSGALGTSPLDALLSVGS